MKASTSWRPWGLQQGYICCRWSAGRIDDPGASFAIHPPLNGQRPFIPSSSISSSIFFLFFFFSFPSLRFFPTSLLMIAGRQHACPHVWTAAPKRLQTPYISGARTSNVVDTKEKARRAHQEQQANGGIVGPKKIIQNQTLLSVSLELRGWIHKK